MLNFIISIFLCSFLASPLAKKESDIRLGYYYELDEHDVRPFANQIEKDLHAHVNLKKYDSFDALVLDYQRGKLDIFISNTFNYLKMSETVDGISPLVVFADGIGNHISYRGCLIASRQSKVTSIDEMLASRSHCSMEFVQPTSTTGHLVPVAKFRDLKVKEADFGFEKLSFAGSHANVIKDVASGQADVGACSLMMVKEMITSGKIKVEDINILWRSKPIPMGPILVRNSFRLKGRLRKWLLELPVSNPKLWGHIKETWGMYEPKTVLVAKESYFDEVKAMMRQISGLTHHYKYMVEK